MKPVDRIYFFDGGAYWSDRLSQLRGDPKRNYGPFKTQAEAVDAMEAEEGKSGEIGKGKPQNK